MRNKALLLATTAIALASMSTPAEAEGMYISVLGGANWQPGTSGFQSTTTRNTTTSTFYAQDPDTGFIIGGTIGGHLDLWIQGLRSEVEVSYRRNDISGEYRNVVQTSGDTNSGEEGPISANASNFALMANVWYDINMGWKAVPYVGGGVGWTRARLDGAVAVTTTTGGGVELEAQSIDQEHSGFAYQVGAGVNYTIADGVQAGVGYRYFHGPRFDPIFVGKNNLSASFENNNHTAMFNLTIAIN